MKFLHVVVYPKSAYWLEAVTRGGCEVDEFYTPVDQNQYDTRKSSFEQLTMITTPILQRKAAV